jgi:UDPglucose 6-dehydrogenase
MLLEAVEAVNARQKQVLFEKISGALRRYARRAHGGDVGPGVQAEHRRHARGRRAAALMEGLWEAGVKVRAYDPKARAETRRIYGDRPDLVLCKIRGRGARGRRLPGARDRVDGVPQSRLRRGQGRP